MRAFIFPGQGSQRKGMGRDLFPRFPDLVRRADDILGYSIAELCLEDPRNQLSLSAFAQPAIFVVSVLAFIEARKTLPPPDCTAGHSVGEYAALAAAQVFDFDTGLRLVSKRAALMGEADGGGLAAVMGLPLEVIGAILAETGEVSVANINTPTQIVVGGPRDALGRFVESCRGRGGRAVPLRVSGAFHTAAMAGAARRFHEFLKTVEFRLPAVPVACNLTGDFYPANPPSAGHMAEVLSGHIESPVLWTSCVERMIGRGVTEFTEIGGTRILAAMVEEIRQSAPLAPSPMHLAPSPLPEPVLPGTTGAAAEAPVGLPGFGRLVAGSIGHGVSDLALVAALARAGTFAFLDTEGVPLDTLGQAIATLSADPATSARFGASLVHGDEAAEDDLIGLLLARHVSAVELRGYLGPTDAVARYRAARRNGQANRVLARVSTRAQFEAFTAQPGDIDAICIDLAPWRVIGPAEPTFALLHEAVARRREGGVVPVGVSAPAASRQAVEALLALGAEFVVVGSAFLLAEEACVPASLREAMARRPASPRLLPDWAFPELASRSWCMVEPEMVGDALEELQRLYTGACPSGHDLAALYRERAEVRALLDAHAIHACEGFSGPLFRARLRHVVRYAMRGRVIPYDGSLRCGETRMPVPAAQIAEALCPLG